MANELNLVGGEHIAPNASPEARQMILLARGMMYSDDMAGALQKAIHGGDYLADGAVPLIAQLIQGLAQQVGELSDVDLHAVVVHLAGSLVDMAEKMGDPDARDKRAAVEDITEGVMAVLSGEIDLSAMSGHGMLPEQAMGAAPDMGAPPLLESARG